MADFDRDLLSSSRVRAACKDVAAGLGHKEVARLWRCEENLVGLKLNETGRHYMKPHELLALKRVDANGLIVAADCEELGYEAPERKQIDDPGEALKRLPGALRKYLRDELAELIEREMGLR
jgi:hypothetical protein